MAGMKRGELQSILKKKSAVKYSKMRRESHELYESYLFNMRA